MKKNCSDDSKLTTVFHSNQTPAQHIKQSKLKLHQYGWSTYITTGHFKTNENQDYKISSSPHIHFRDTMVPFWGDYLSSTQTVDSLNKYWLYLQLHGRGQANSPSVREDFTVPAQVLLKIVTLFTGSVNCHLDNQPTLKTRTIIELYVASSLKHGNKNIHSMSRNNCLFMLSIICMNILKIWISEYSRLMTGSSFTYKGQKQQWIE